MNSKDNNRQTLKWIYLRTKKFLPLIVLLSIVSALTAVSYVVLALLTKNVLDIATGAMEGSFAGAGISLFAVIAVQVSLSALQSVLNTYTNGKLTISLRNYLFSAVCRKKYADISIYHSGDLLNRFTSDVDVIVLSAVSIIPSIVSMATKIVAGIGTLLVLNPILALVILLLGVAVPAIGRIINRRYKQLHKECQKTEGKTRSFLQECFENIVVIKTFVSEIPFINRLGQYMSENFRLKMKRNTISIIAHLSLYSFFTVGYYAVLLWGAGGIASGTLTYGTLMAFLQLISQLRTPLQNVSGIIPQYYSALASAERLIEIENCANESTSAPDAELEKIKSGFKTLDVKDVNFGYGGELILRNCSFEAERGKITAITGESGSGKSTLFKLILGLYEPHSGSITVNGSISADASVRGLFSYVPQGNMVLSGTIRENLTLCNGEISEERLIKAAETADIYELIKELPLGFDTQLSERGAGLLEGQLQRISIARALLVGAPVLLLDEATSALDEETETRVLSNIKQMTDKTVLFITHRNTSLKVCDRIVHVENKNFAVIK